ncbi:hypothetical protein JCM10213_008759 [Rhodosporidiobolus nylandii]
MSSSAFTSPLGPLHFAHPSEQSASTRTLFSLFRRSGSSSSKPNSSRALKKVHPSSSTLEYTFERATHSTYSPSPCTSSSSSSSENGDDLAPPPYSTAAGLEEDLVVVEEEPVLKVETPAQRKERLKAEKLERKRQELLAADRRMDEALRSWGL